MKLNFRTKTDVNGNSYRVTIDTDNKKIIYDNAFGGIVISKTDYKQLISQLKAEGFKDVIKLH